MMSSFILDHTVNLESHEQLTRGVDLNISGESSNSNEALNSSTSTCSDVVDHTAQDSSPIENDAEPLGYQHFLYDVNIEYSLGGNSTLNTNNRFSLKMKCLPYMVQSSSYRKSSIGSSDNSFSDNHTTHDDIISHAHSPAIKSIDVRSATCAFLGNSEYVPTSQFEQRRVTFELISANSIDLPRQSTNQSPLVSKKFVNYTLVIKYTPGLDKHPAVIERRFSDFLNLYTGLRNWKSYDELIQQNVNFPKKIYMGNFSLNNIAKRSIEFSKLLELCMTTKELLWSKPFVSFLFDKELREAHRLSLFGEPDSDQVMIETVLHILQKLYMDDLHNRLSTSNSSSISLNLADQQVDETNNSPSTSVNTLQHHSSCELGNEIISIRCNTSSPCNQTLEENDGSDEGLSDEESSLSSLNQRILVTYCMLFLCYSKTEQFKELGSAIKSFIQLISCRKYIISIVNTRHCTSLRCCLLFLMNLTKDSLIDVNTRSWLKNKLEDIDADCSSRNKITNGNIKGDLAALLKNRYFTLFPN